MMMMMKKNLENADSIGINNFILCLFMYSLNLNII